MSQGYIRSMNDNYHIQNINRSIERFEKIGTKKRFPKGYRIDYTQAPPTVFYVILTGELIAYEISYEGKYRVYNIMASGSAFLEEYVLFPLPCPIIFETMVDSVLIEIRRCDLIRVMKTDIDLVLDVMESLSEKFVSSMEQLRLGPRQEAEWKLCRTLISYAKAYGRPYKTGILIEQKVSHQSMADLLGLNRVTVTRKLKKLREKGLIEIVDGHIYIPDLAAVSDHLHHLELS